MTLLSFIIKDMSRRKFKLFLTIAGVSIGIAACIMMMGLSESICDTLKGAYLKRHIDIIVLEKDECNILSSRIDDTLTGRIKALPQIEDATGVLLDLTKFKKNLLPLYGWPLSSQLFKTIRIYDGRMPTPDSNEVILGDALARNSMAGVGSVITIKSKKFTVVGLFRSEIPFEKSAMIIPLETLQKLDRKNTGKVIAINISLRPGFKDADKMAPIIEEIEQLSPAISAQPVELFAEEKTRQIVMGEKFAALVALITIIAVILGLANTMITSVFEKKKLIGILLAMGWQKRDVFRAILLESLIIMAIGGLLGIVLGYYAIHRAFSLMSINIFTPHWDTLFTIKIICVTLACGIGSALVPSLIILRLNPLEAIKNE